MKLCFPLNLPFNINQKWGEGATFYKQLGMAGHNGWDFSCAVGTPVYATHEGIVFFAGIDSTMSETISIDTLLGDYRTFYCHLNDTKVKAGDHVKRGQLIGLSGNTGRYTTGPHLHFGIHPIPTNLNSEYNGAIDPAPFWDWTYPSDEEKVDTKELFNKLMFAARDYQIANGVMDFAKETNPKKIKIGPKTLQLITKDSL